MFNKMFKKFSRACRPACKNLGKTLFNAAITTMASIVIADKFSNWYAKHKAKKLKKKKELEEK